MKSYDWASRVKVLYLHALERYQAGHRDPQTLFDAEGQQELADIGAKPMELFDYAEDAAALDWETALLILAARRDYFLVIQKGVPSAHRISMAELPAKDAELEGIPWLPRLIEKAKARLRGEMPDELMYGCGGDRRFFSQHDIHPADFLREVWATGGDEQKILAYVRRGGKP
ncbi:MAG: DUF5069 domain-containing protein [Verrucomicrobiota bacterium]